MKQVKIKSYFRLVIELTLAVLTTASIITFLIVIENNKESSSNPNFKEAKVLVNTALSFIENNFDILNIDTRNTELENILSRDNLKLQVIDLKGHLIYNFGTSNNLKEEINIKYIDLETADSYNYVSPVVINGIVVGNSIFSIPKDKLIVNTESKILVYFIPLIIGILVCLIILLKMYSFMLTYVLNPIKELSVFTGRISKGRYNNRLKYEINSEITELSSGFELMQEELVYALESQGKLEKERKELIACISHDLRTPLASIKAYVGAINDGFAKDPLALKNYVRVINDKTDNILELINDFFEHSKAELGQLRINKVQNYSRKLILKIIETYEIEFNKNGITFIVDTEIPELLIEIDELRIEQVIFNIFQNAMKYTALGGNVHFGVFSEKDFLKFYVKDTGVGISTMELPHIFDKFYRGEKGQSIEYHEGTGLGLYICKYIVEAHGGEIYVESKINQGTIVYFTIPKV